MNPIPGSSGSRTILLIGLIVVGGVLTLAFSNCSPGFKAISSEAVTSPNSATSTGPDGGTPAPNPTPDPNPAPNALPIVDVAVGTGGMRLSSTDSGQTWKYTTDGVTNNDCWAYRGIAYGNGLFVAVTGTGGFGRISTSPDGVHWRNYESIHGSNGVGFGGGIFFSDSFVSNDGYNFTFRKLNVDVGKHASFAYLNGHYFISGALNGIAVGTDGSNFTITLPNYTSPNYNDFFSNIFQFAVGNGVVVGMSYARLAASSDLGATWTNQDNFFGYGSSPPANAEQYNGFHTIIFDGTQFVVYGGTGRYGGTPTTWKSTDGVHWTMSTGAQLLNTVGGDASTHFFGFTVFSPFSAAANMLTSFDQGKSWLTASAVSASDFYDFSSPTAPVANPTLSSFTGYGVSHLVSGRASSDPAVTPTLPASVLLTHDQLAATACGNNIPAGR